MFLRFEPQTHLGNFILVFFCTNIINSFICNFFFVADILSFRNLNTTTKSVFQKMDEYYTRLINGKSGSFITKLAENDNFNFNLRLSLLPFQIFIIPSVYFDALETNINPDFQIYQDDRLFE